MHVTITTFTDPMMGLSYECEPIFRKLETHFENHIEFKYVMSGLVRDVYHFVDKRDLLLDFLVLSVLFAYMLQKAFCGVGGLVGEEESIRESVLPSEFYQHISRVKIAPAFRDEYRIAARQRLNDV